MKLRRKKSLLTAVLLLCFTNMYSQETPYLKIGDDAPPLYITKWLKGKPVQHFEKGKTYLIEFTFVGCPPCRRAIPHLTKIARKHQKNGTAEVVSVFTNESNLKDPTNLKYIKDPEALLRTMGDQMDYTIGIDIHEQKTKAKWMINPGMNINGKLGDYGYPQAFIVNKHGKIAYIGPVNDELDAALETIASTGQYNPATDRPEVLTKLGIFWDSYYKRYLEAKTVKDYPAMLQLIDSSLAHIPWEDLPTGPEKKNELLCSKIRVLAVSDPAAANRSIREILDHKPEQFTYARLLNLLTYDTITSLDYDLVLELADRYIEEQQTPLLKVHALCEKAMVAYSYTHNKEKAMSILEEALQLSKKENIPSGIKRYERCVEILQKEGGGHSANEVMQYDGSGTLAVGIFFL